MRKFFGEPTPARQTPRSMSIRMTTIKYYET
jgi:hypothetical protein